MDFDAREAWLASLTGFLIGMFPVVVFLIIGWALHWI